MISVSANVFDTSTSIEQSSDGLTTLSFGNSFTKRSFSLVWLVAIETKISIQLIELLVYK